MEVVLPIPVLVSLIGVTLILKKRKKNLRKWAKRLLVNRKKHSNLKLKRQLRMNESKNYKHYLRMDEENFQYLLHKTHFFHSAETTPYSVNFLTTIFLSLFLNCSALIIP